MATRARAIDIINSQVDTVLDGEQCHSDKLIEAITEFWSTYPVNSITSHFEAITFEKKWGYSPVIWGLSSN